MDLLDSVRGRRRESLRKHVTDQRRQVTEQELENINLKICVVCMTAAASMQTFPCGHKVVCRKCLIKTIQMVVTRRSLPLRCVVCRDRVLRLQQSNPHKAPTSSSAVSPTKHAQSSSFWRVPQGSRLTSSSLTYPNIVSPISPTSFLSLITGTSYQSSFSRIVSPATARRRDIVPITSSANNTLHSVPTVTHLVNGCRQEEPDSHSRTNNKRLIQTYTDVIIIDTSIKGEDSRVAVAETSQVTTSNANQTSTHRKQEINSQENHSKDKSYKTKVSRQQNSRIMYTQSGPMSISHMNRCDLISHTFIATPSVKIHPAHTPSPHTPSVKIHPAHTPSVKIHPTHIPVAHTPSVKIHQAHTPSVKIHPAHTPSVKIHPAHTSSVKIHPAHTPSVKIHPAHTPSVKIHPTHTRQVNNSFMDAINKDDDACSVRPAVPNNHFTTSSSLIQFLIRFIPKSKRRRCTWFRRE